MTLQDYGVLEKKGKKKNLYQTIDVREGEKAKTRDKRRDAHRLEKMNKKLDPVGSTVRYEMIKLFTGSV